jgi:hypothetical protein
VPIVFTVDHERREVHSIAIGPVTFESIRTHLMQEKHWRGLTYPELVDARGAGIDFTPSEVREVVELLRNLGAESRLGPTAVLVSSDAAYGIIRMLEMLVEDVCEIKPFRDESEARAWLASKSPAA